ncbi:unnamed protein product [Protopolystoma xenopodis]|uniref:Uncharacterized protein n=1 Tax=Protopolystoma xenopodis TaxID=117903 RepID=A0A3S5BA94_9PLAT|nr:unnamed protein product [Protopolystoma xenopodis]
MIRRVRLAPAANSGLASPSRSAATVLAMSPRRTPQLTSGRQGRSGSHRLSPELDDLDADLEAADELIASLQGNSSRQVNNNTQSLSARQQQSSGNDNNTSSLKAHITLSSCHGHYRISS